MTDTTADDVPESILQVIIDNLEDGDSIVELAEEFLDDPDVEKQHPELNALFRQVVDAAQGILIYLNR